MMTLFVRPQVRGPGLTFCLLFGTFWGMRLGGVVLATILAVGACSSEPTPKEPPRSPTPTATTPADAAPTLPAQASEDSPEGAAAFVNHYIDVLNYAARTGDVEGLSELSSPDCTGCQRYIKLYRDTYAAGGYFKGGDWKPGKFELGSSNSETFISTDVTSAATTYRERSGSPERVGAVETNKITFAIAGDAGKRFVSQMALDGAK